MESRPRRVWARPIGMASRKPRRPDQNIRMSVCQKLSTSSGQYSGSHANVMSDCRNASAQLALHDPQHGIRAERHGEVDGPRRAVEQEIVFGGAGRLLGRVEQLGKADDADQRRVLEEDEPKIGKAGKSER